jgi:hypothetical protein
MEMKRATCRKARRREWHDGMMLESFAAGTFENLGKIEQLSVLLNLQLNSVHSALAMQN